jgi:hypothetical protein
MDITKYASMPVERLKTELVNEPKKVRASVYAWLYANRKEDALQVRPVLEALRGIKRDENGHIIRTVSWKKSRRAILMTKKADYQQRIKNIDAELAQLGGGTKGDK